MTEWGINVNKRGQKIREPCQFFYNHPVRVEDIIKFVTQDRDEKQSEETILVRKWLADFDFCKKIGKELNLNELKELSKDIRYCFRKKGQKLLSAGLQDDRMYFILRGKVKLFLPQKEVATHFPHKKTTTLPDINLNNITTNIDESDDDVFMTQKTAK